MFTQVVVLVHTETLKESRYYLKKTNLYLGQRKSGIIRQMTS